MNVRNGLVAGVAVGLLFSCAQTFCAEMGKDKKEHKLLTRGVESTKLDQWELVDNEDEKKKKAANETGLQVVQKKNKVGVKKADSSVLGAIQDKLVFCLTHERTKGKNGNPIPYKDNYIFEYVVRLGPVFNQFKSDKNKRYEIAGVGLLLELMAAQVAVAKKLQFPVGQKVLATFMGKFSQQEVGVARGELGGSETLLGYLTTDELCVYWKGKSNENQALLDKATCLITEK